MINKNFFNYQYVNDDPPTLYSIMQSIVNYGKQDKTKIKDLAKESRTTIFNFDYQLSSLINKEDFECMILNHYMMRRINFDTPTLFQIQLCNKLNVIMPKYNKIFDSFIKWDMFKDGEVTTKESVDDRIINVKSATENTIDSTSINSAQNTQDLRNSKLPQNQLENVRDGKYMSEYNYNTNNSNSNDTSKQTGNSSNTTNTNDKNNINETISRTQHDKANIYLMFQNDIQNIYNLIFDELDELFYGIV